MRQNYIDNIRGLCILLVIYHHIILYGMPEYNSSLNKIMISFRMPMFFFISGYVSVPFKWDGISTYTSKLLKKYKDNCYHR